MAKFRVVVEIRDAYFRVVEADSEVEAREIVEDDYQWGHGEGWIHGGLSSDIIDFYEVKD